MGQPTLVDETLIDKREVARRLSKTVRTVDYWMKRGKLPYIKIGHSVLFRWGAVIEKLETFRIN